MCYYRAIKDGALATVNIIDKASLVVAVLLAWFILGGSVTPRILVGCGLVIAGVITASHK